MFSLYLSHSKAHRVVSLALVAAAVVYAQSPAPANLFLQHNLVSDVPGLADSTDPNLVNPWGISRSATSPFWISNQGKGNTTLYNGSGTVLPLVVTIPSGVKGPTPSKPTGQVQNASKGFVLANGKPAAFIFATEDGTISAWNGGPTATLMADNSAAGAVYTGLAIGADSSGPLLYAANFNTGAIDVFDAKFAPAKVSGGFADPTLPAGFAPFNVWNLAGKLYVTYAKQNDSKTADVAGAGNGFVDAFDMDGNFLARLVSNGPLNSPWGVAIAPLTFGPFGGALLVGNFGDGAINAFDVDKGTALGTLQDSAGKPIAIQGLWALIFGNGANGGDRNTLYFTAGITVGGALHGLFGSLAPPSAVLAAANGASWTTGAVAPGEVVVLSGLTIGPSPLAAAKISAGSVAKTLGGVTVTFNGTPAPILYASASDTSVLVPYEIAGSTTANVVVSYRNQTTAAFPVQVAASAPGLFTLDFSGAGQAIAFNQDGTLNSAANPASAGSVVVLFGTGEGTTTPAGQDGLVSGDILRGPVLPVKATIGNQPATVVYAGSSPGLVLGVMQVEAVVPAGAGTGAVPVVVTVGTAGSQSGVTINVK